MLLRSCRLLTYILEQTGLPYIRRGFRNSINLLPKILKRISPFSSHATPSTDEDLEGQNASSMSSPAESSRCSKPTASTSSKNKEDMEIIVIKDADGSAPNLLLNCHERVGRSAIYLAAAIGLILQLGAVVYFGFITYYKPTQDTFLKDGRRVVKYAFPCAAVGTLLLVLGLFICSWVVGKSTKETCYEAEDHDIYVVWLQKDHTVSDQVFKPFAVYPTGKREYITMSRRRNIKHRRNEIGGLIINVLDRLLSYDKKAGKPGNNNDQVTIEVGNNSKKLPTEVGSNNDDRMIEVSNKNNTRLIEVDNNNQKLLTEVGSNSNDDRTIGVGSNNNKLPTEVNSQPLYWPMESITFIGALISLIGFISQFIGMRGLHWTASIVQLGITILVTIMRVIVRRGLGKPPAHTSLNPKFELDWFVLSFGQLSKAPWVNSGRASRNYANQKKDTRDKTRPKWEIRTRTAGELRRHTDSSQPIEDSEPHRIMLMRKRLGKLSEWKSPFLKEAIHLSRAIEAVANTFLSGQPKESYKWSIPAIYTEYNFAEPIEGKNVKEEVVEENVVKENVYITIYKDESHGWRVDETEIEAILSLWLYSTSATDLPEISRPRNLRAYELDGSEKRLTRDLEWWMPDNIPQSFKRYSENDLAELIRKEPERTAVGYNVDTTKRSTTTTTQHNPMKKYLVFECQDNQQRLFSRELFHSFMRAIAKMPEVDIASASSAHPLSLSTMSEGWKQMKLKNEIISGLARKFEKIGFGSLSDIYIDLIIPLTLEHKLTNVKDIIDDVAREAHEYERTLQWENVVDTCIRLLDLALCFDLEKDSSSTRAIAICLGFLHRLHHEAKLQEAERRIEEELTTQLARLKKRFIGDNFRISAYFSIILPDKLQFFAASLSMLAGINSSPISFPNSFQIAATNLDFIQARNSKQKLDIPDIKVFEKTDAFGWSLLHYAASLTLDIDNNWQVSDKTIFPTPRDLMEWTPLHHACVSGNKELVEMLLRYRAPIEIAGKDGITPMHCAVQSGKVEIIQQLIDHKKHRRNIRHVDRNERHPIHWAAVEGNVEMVHLLEDDIDLPDRFGWTPLHLATIYGHYELLRSISDDHTYTINIGDNELRTPLHLAVEYQLLDAVQTLIQVGANVKTSRKDGRTPLHAALSRGEDGLEVAKILLRAGADVNTVAQDGATALHIAAQSGGLFDFLNFLLDNNLETPAIDATDEYGQTALLIAIYEAEWEAVKLLLERGAGVNAGKRNGYAPVLGAVIGENEDILQRLLDMRASVDDTDGDGYSALHFAVLNRNHKIVFLLLKAGAHIDAIARLRSETPLHIAVRKGDTEIVQALLEKGADTVLFNSLDFSPLQYALYCENLPMVHVLIEHDKKSTTKAASQPNKEGDTPLHTLAACTSDDEDTICEMLDELLSIGPGIDINAKNKEGRTPLDLALLIQSKDCRRLITKLLERDAEPGSDFTTGFLEEWKEEILGLQ